MVWHVVLFLSSLLELHERSLLFVSLHLHPVELRNPRRAAAALHDHDGIMTRLLLSNPILPWMLRINSLLLRCSVIREVGTVVCVASVAGTRGVFSIIRLCSINIIQKNKNHFGPEQKSTGKNL